MGQMILKTTHEDFYVFTQSEENFKEVVKEYPARYENAEMHSVSILQKKPDWVHNRSILDFKLDGEYYHAQYLMGWYIDAENVEGLVKVADDYVKDFVAIPKTDRDPKEYFSDANCDMLLDRFFKIAGIEVDD